MFECKAGGVRSCGPSVGVGYESTNDLHDDFSRGTMEVADGGDGGVPGPKDGMAVGMLLMLHQQNRNVFFSLYRPLK